MVGRPRHTNYLQEFNLVPFRQDATVSHRNFEEALHAPAPFLNRDQTKPNKEREKGERERGGERDQMVVGEGAGTKT